MLENRVQPDITVLFAREAVLFGVIAQAYQIPQFQTALNGSTHFLDLACGNGALSTALHRFLKEINAPTPSFDGVDAHPKPHKDVIYQNRFTGNLFDPATWSQIKLTTGQYDLIIGSAVPGKVVAYLAENPDCWRPLSCENSLWILTKDNPALPQDANTKIFPISFGNLSDCLYSVANKLIRIRG